MRARFLLAMCVGAPLFAQQPGEAKSEEMTSVPFIGCVSFGQGERSEAPAGTTMSMPINPADAAALAYYKSADGTGVLGPRGWFCQGTSGSGGYALFLSPAPIRWVTTGWQGLAGPAIEVNHINSENSGRYEIAEIMARVFPHLAHSQNVF